MAQEHKPAVKEEVPDIVPFDRTKKKKKKKVVIRDSSSDSVDKLAEKTEALAVSDGQESAFSGLKKKKKKLVESSISNEEGSDTRFRQPNWG